MSLGIAVVFLTLALIASNLSPISERTGLPLSAYLVFFGLVASEALVFYGFDTGLRWHHFQSLVLHILVPILVFESALHISWKDLKQGLPLILALAIPGILLSAIIAGYLLFIGVGHSGFPFTSALLAGLILAATDPVAVVDLFKRFGVPSTLLVMVEGESLFNDATAVVLFAIIVLIATQGFNPVEDSYIAISQFFYSFCLGAVVGALGGGIGVLLWKPVKEAWRGALISLWVPASVLWLSEHVFQASSVVAVLIAGLILGPYMSAESSKKEVALGLWQLQSQIANAIIFLLLGASVTLEMFTSHWLAMVIGVGAAMLSRACLVYFLCATFNRLPIQGCKTRWIDQHILVWGGLRGTIAISLALAIPEEVTAWYSIQSVIYGVVLFSIFFQAPTMQPLVKRAN